MSEPLTLYAIEVTHTKKGKPRKRRAWAGVHKLSMEPSLIDCDFRDAWHERGEAEEHFGCKCRVVTFREVRDE